MTTVTVVIQNSPYKENNKAWHALRVNCGAYIPRRETLSIRRPRTRTIIDMHDNILNIIIIIIIKTVLWKLKPF